VGTSYRRLLGLVEARVDDGYRKNFNPAFLMGKVKKGNDTWMVDR